MASTIRRYVPLVCATFLATAAAAAHAGVPDPRFCDADTCLVISPGGAFPYAVVLRDESTAPLAAVIVTLDFTSAPGIVLCPAADPDYDRRMTAITDAIGHVEFRVRGGGQTTGYAVLSALGQTIRVVYPRSTDLSGNDSVGLEDVDLHAALPLLSRAGDYDCDGDSDAADRALIQAQIGQDCATVPVLSSTWGRVKALYR